jgi:hypothetical protein
MHVIAAVLKHSVLCTWRTCHGFESGERSAGFESGERSDGFESLE